MNERNKLSVSPIQGENILHINGFKIILTIDCGLICATVYRKGKFISDFTTIQEAVKWCEE